jgi:hypothetical protein
MTETKLTMHVIAATLTFKCGSETKESEKAHVSNGSNNTEGHTKFMNNQAHCKTRSTAKHRVVSKRVLKP